MNYVDEQYLNIARDILENGTVKQTRAGEVIGVFDRTVRFDLKKGLPLLTTKKVFTKGIIHELLWFLSGDTNIKYLIDNNVNIWTDDAYRYYNELVNKQRNIVSENKPPRDFYIMEPIEPVSKEEFVEKVKKQDKELIVLNKNHYIMSFIPNSYCMDYTYGDLGPVYGQQWRGKEMCSSNRFCTGKIDQVKTIIDKLKNNPDDRRMICNAYNPTDINSDYGVALPPCHVMWQVYSREVSHNEKLNWYNQTHPGEEIDACESPVLDKLGVPKRELSLMWVQRSVDFCAGAPFNITSYSILLYILAQITNHIPGEVIGHFEDTHIYTNHIDGIKEQMTRKGSDIIPQLKFTRELTDIDDLKFDDFIITDYYPDPVIKYALNVG